MLAPQQFSRTNIIIPAQEFSRINSKGAQAFSRTNNGCTECPPEQNWEWLLASVSSSCKCAGAQNPRCLAKPPTSGTSHSIESWKVFCFSVLNLNWIDEDACIWSVMHIDDSSDSEDEDKTYLEEFMDGIPIWTVQRLFNQTSMTMRRIWTGILGQEIL